jgi:hypothetical protein
MPLVSPRVRNGRMMSLIKDMLNTKLRWMLREF